MIKSENGLVTISEDYYNELLSDSRFLECLQNAGVDNWEWFDEARAEYSERYGDDN